MIRKNVINMFADLVLDLSLMLIMRKLFKMNGVVQYAYKIGCALNITLVNLMFNGYLNQLY